MRLALDNKERKEIVTYGSINQILQQENFILQGVAKKAALLHIEMSKFYEF